jgi:hypothetical protein
VRIIFNVDEVGATLELMRRLLAEGNTVLTITTKIDKRDAEKIVAKALDDRELILTFSNVGIGP